MQRTLAYSNGRHESKGDRPFGGKKSMSQGGEKNGQNLIRGTSNETRGLESPKNMISQRERERFISASKKKKGEKGRISQESLKTEKRARQTAGEG